MAETFVYEVCYIRAGRRFYFYVFSIDFENAFRVAIDTLDIKFRDYLIVSVKQCDEF